MVRGDDAERAGPGAADGRLRGRAPSGTPPHAPSPSPTARPPEDWKVPVPHAIVLGSIGTLAETSELQRHAFDEAFQEAGLPWRWDAATYRTLLGRSGGRARIEAYAAERGDTVDADALHAAKSRHFQRALADAQLPLRGGVGALLAAAAERGVPVALATSTSAANVDGILRATGLTRDRFAAVVDRSMIAHAKPAPDAFLEALHRLGIRADEAVAVEDNPDGARAALEAGLRCLVRPGEAHEATAFPDAAERVEDLVAAVS